MKKKVWIIVLVILAVGFAIVMISNITTRETYKKGSDDTNDSNYEESVGEDDESKSADSTETGGTGGDKQSGDSGTQEDGANPDTNNNTNTNTDTDKDTENKSEEDAGEGSEDEDSTETGTELPFVPFD